MSDERLLAALKALKEGDLSVRLPENESGTAGEIAVTFNALANQLSEIVSEVNRISQEIGVQGRLGGQAQVQGLSGAWDEMQKNVNHMEYSVTSQIRKITLMADLIVNNGRIQSNEDWPKPLDEFDYLGHFVARLARMMSEPV